MLTAIPSKLGKSSNLQELYVLCNCIYGQTSQTSVVHSCVVRCLPYIYVCRFLSGNRINTILNDDLPKNLITLELRGNPLGDIQFDALQRMPKLRKLYVSIIYKLKMCSDCMVFFMDPYTFNTQLMNIHKKTLPKPTECLC